MDSEKLSQYINWYYIVILLIISIIIILIIENYYNKPKTALKYINNTYENFNILKPKAEIILYYTSWCGYSLKMLPEWQKFINYAKDNLKHITVTTIKCDDEKEKCSIKEVNGFPTIILKKNNGETVIFNDERKMEKFIDFTNVNV